MTKRQNQKLAMYLAVIKALEQMEAEGKALPSTESMHAAFRQLVAGIQEVVQERITGRMQATYLRRNARKLLEAELYTVIKGLAAWAAEQQRPEITMELERSRSRLRDERHVFLARIAAETLRLARSVEADLSRYGVGQLADLDTALQGYEVLLAAPRAAINQRQERTKRLRQLFQQADTLLREQLDRVMETRFGTPHYSVYRSARLVGHVRTASAPKPVSTPVISGLLAQRMALRV
jgi:hypothetical protein